MADHRRLGAAAVVSDRLYAAAQYRGPRATSKSPSRSGRLEAKERAQREVRFVYEQDKEPLVQLRAGLHEPDRRGCSKVQSLAELEDGVWQEFFASSTPGSRPCRRPSRNSISRRSASALADARVH